MSLAFLLFLLWLPLALASDWLGALWHGRTRPAVLAAGAGIVLLALASGGLLPAAFALIGVLAVVPEPIALARNWLVALVNKGRNSRAAAPPTARAA